MCTDDASGFKRPVGWVGAGPGAEFCNVWKCEDGSGGEFSEGNDTGFNGPDAQAHFKRQKRKCSVEEHDYNFCSHTTCTFAVNDFSDNKKVINVHSDHREETGGNHTCGYAKAGFSNNEEGAAGIFDNEMGSHLNDNTEGVHRAGDGNACECVCYGARRQDADNFARVLNQMRVVENVTEGSEDTHDETTNNNDYDADNNHNNFYSKHYHADAYTATGNNNANAYVGSNKGNWDGESTHVNDATKTEYLENGNGVDGHMYANGQYVAHKHVTDGSSTDPYDSTHKNAALYSGNSGN